MLPTTQFYCFRLLPLASAPPPKMSSPKKFLEAAQMKAQAIEDTLIEMNNKYDALYEQYKHTEASKRFRELDEVKYADANIASQLARNSEQAFRAAQEAGCKMGQARVGAQYMLMRNELGCDTKEMRYELFNNWHFEYANESGYGPYTIDRLQQEERAFSERMEVKMAESRSLALQAIEAKKAYDTKTEARNAMYDEAKKLPGYELFQEMLDCRACIRRLDKERDGINAEVTKAEEALREHNKELARKRRDRKDEESKKMMKA